MESQPPSGSKPPPPKPEGPETEAPWISPRLREKLQSTEPEKPLKGSSPLPWIVLVVLVIGGGIGGITMLRSGAARQKAEVERQARAAAAESAAAVARADSMRLAIMDTSATAVPSPGTGASAVTGAGATTKPTATPTTSTAMTSKPPTTTGSKSPTPPVGASKSSSAPPAGSGTSTGGAATAGAARGPFGIDVGTFLFEDRANSEQTRLAGSTGLSGKVAAKTEGDATVYHVILGSFATRAEAEKEAGALIAKGLVREASPVPLSR